MRTFLSSKNLHESREVIGLPLLLYDYSKTIPEALEYLFSINERDKKEAFAEMDIA